VKRRERREGKRREGKRRERTEEREEKRENRREQKRTEENRREQKRTEENRREQKRTEENRREQKKRQEVKIECGERGFSEYVWMSMRVYVFGWIFPLFFFFHRDARQKRNRHEKKTSRSMEWTPMTGWIVESYSKQASDQSNNQDLFTLCITTLSSSSCMICHVSVSLLLFMYPPDP